MTGPYSGMDHYIALTRWSQIIGSDIGVSLVSSKAPGSAKSEALLKGFLQGLGWGRSKERCQPPEDPN